MHALEGLETLRVWVWSNVKATRLLFPKGLITNAVQPGWIEPGVKHNFSTQAKRTNLQMETRHFPLDSFWKQS